MEHLFEKLVPQFDPKHIKSSRALFQLTTISKTLYVSGSSVVDVQGFSTDFNCLSIYHRFTASAGSGITYALFQ